MIRLVLTMRMNEEDIWTWESETRLTVHYKDREQYRPGLLSDTSDRHREERGVLIVGYHCIEAQHRSHPLL